MEYKMVNLDKQGNIYTLTFEGDGGNALDLELVQAIHSALDTVEEDSKGPCALILTATGKSFSSGLSLLKITSYNSDQVLSFSNDMQRLYGRLVNFPVPTIAAINGHAFAAGAFLALSCDYRVMRRDKGWFCISEIDVGVSVVPEIMAVAQLKLSKNVLRDAVLTGKRFSGEDCLQLAICDATCEESELLDTAKEIIAPVALKKRQIFKNFKTTLYGDCAKGMGVNS
jgi:enoyl-CoA hydratase/carnithine racemase